MEHEHGHRHGKSGVHEDQGQPAVYETISARINAGEYLFTAASSRLAFDGFMSVYTDPDEEKKEKNAAVRSLEAGTELALEKMDPQQHFTQPPAHYTEASLVKTLEELIGISGLIGVWIVIFWCHKMSFLLQKSAVSHAVCQKSYSKDFIM